MAQLECAYITFENRLRRFVWSIVYSILFRCTPRNAFWWRRFVLQLFGAELSKGVKVYASARIWAPWNLKMQEGSCLGDNVICYNVSPVCLGYKAVVSQYSFLCTATHDFDVMEHTLMIAPIDIGDHAWVAADCFVAPGVCIGAGCVVLARSTVLTNTDPWWVVGGYPATLKRERGWRKSDTAKSGDERI